MKTRIKKFCILARFPRFFTLIELLIVVAIIAILAGMLLPALNNARKKGKDALCRSRLKTLGQCEMFYAADYDDYMLPARVPWETSGNCLEWYQLLWTLSYDRVHCSRLNKYSGNMTYGTPLCPGAPPEGSFICGTTPWKLWQDNGKPQYSWGGYGRGRTVGGMWYDKSNGFISPFKKIGKIISPSVKVSLFDCAMAIIPEKYGKTYWNNGSCTSAANNGILWLSHDRKINFIAVDSHVETLHYKRWDSGVKDMWNRHFVAEGELGETRN